MLSLFRSTQAYAGLPFLFYAVVLQLPVLLGGGALVAPNWAEHGFIGYHVAEWAAAHTWLAIILPPVLVAILALQASALSNRHQFTRVSTQLAPLGVLLAWGLVPGFRLLHPAMLANIFLGFALLAICRIYKNQFPQFTLFNAGAWVAMASFFAPSYLLFLLPCYVGSAIMGRAGFVELIRLLTGALVLYFLAGTLAYFYGNLAVFTGAQVPRFSLEIVSAGPYEVVFAGLLSVLSLALSTQFSPVVRFINIEGSKGVAMLYWLLLFTPLAVVFTGGVSPIDTYALVMPAGVLLGLTIRNLSARTAELVHLLLAVAALICGAGDLSLLAS
ncbi:hypothetical protein [Neolewinella antarctica]|uniref:Uncharacterized protein n=1 Tax=Neolewinella antarctica TaxID=442734 RepID=A0ABX0XFX0_9BACT|nr:hypothetical protein [Neolewinella antarctica]NJC28224.1 hypothetical protein [Neolewinella antarctica]